VESGLRAAGAWFEREHGRPDLATVAVEIFRSGARGRIFDVALARIGAVSAPDLIAQLVAVYRRHAPGLRLFPDANTALALWRARPDVRLGIITDGYAAVQRGKLAALHLEGVVDHIICTDELGREFWKPSPVAFEQLAALAGCRAEACVYVGDNPAKDFVAPNRLGWRTVRIRRPGGEHAAAEADPALGPEYRARDEITSLDELSAVLAEG